MLALRVDPLTKCELEVEAKEWVSLLREKIKEISNAKVAAFYKKQEIKKSKVVDASLEKIKTAKEANDSEKIKAADKVVEEAQKEAEEIEKISTEDSSVQEAIAVATDKAIDEGKTIAPEENTTAAKTDTKIALDKYASSLTTQRTALLDRLKVVLTEYAAKGGDIKEYNTYIEAVSGITLDVTDFSATWTTISGWLSSAEGGLRWLVNFIKFIVIITVFYILSLLAGKAARRVLSKSSHTTTLLRNFLIMTARRLTLIIGFFIGLSALEINIGPVLAIIGAAGFVIALALQNSLSNFASGILMLIYRPFDIGDFVNVASTPGTVESMNLLSTQLRTSDNQLVVVPNNSVWGDVIINVTGITERRIDLVFGIGYSDDVDKAHQILEDIVNENELVLKEPEAKIRLHELADSSVNFICRPWVKPEDYWDVYWGITREVKRRFDAEGISIPFPQQDIHIIQDQTEK
ncbi:mechanosensitive ion channel family protein [Cocleimonas flava]|uniref:Small-conductance mechanosensitive channel n=1 Tax=Cocleimonas flava TaxID=634765 RepID=A0A4R1F9B3_9GAMM|nr:mechanosensitive ion channel domain-containing protein [Cocleimonas flava]TCJ88448.1 small conductance mechanosensitive channel [Cocleimonas flava]